MVAGREWQRRGGSARDEASSGKGHRSVCQPNLESVAWCSRCPPLSVETAVPGAADVLPSLSKPRCLDARPRHKTRCGRSPATRPGRRLEITITAPHRLCQACPCRDTLSTIAIGARAPATRSLCPRHGVWGQGARIHCPVLPGSCLALQRWTAAQSAPRLVYHGRRHLCPPAGHRCPGGRPDGAWGVRSGGLCRRPTGVSSAVGATVGDAAARRNSCGERTHAVARSCHGARGACSFLS